MFCFCLFVRCFFKENFANLLFFSWAQIILSPTINYEGKHKKPKQQNSKHVSNALIWVLKLLPSFVVLLFLIIILSVIYWPQQKKKNPSITDVSSKFVQFFYRCMLASAKFFRGVNLGENGSNKKGKCKRFNSKIIIIIIDNIKNNDSRVFSKDQI